MREEKECLEKNCSDDEVIEFARLFSALSPKKRELAMAHLDYLTTLGNLSSALDFQEIEH